LGVKWFKESGKFTITVDEGIVLRWGATTNSSKIGVLPKGSVVKYDAFCHFGGYVWIRQPRGNGQFGYLPTGESSGGKRTSTWGKFE
ncbi:SH3 domain-containing protein, partial [Ligilactobacillus salivarius]|uniref:SH3 domain-containing protein n=1 Tax=Ligilactobacillus salivarius TaxID=1624 RepID=UPI0013CD13C7